jgi:DNA processing protein
VFAVPGNVTNRNSWGPNTLIKQGAKLTATWEDVWEDLPADVRLEADRSSASEPAATASLFQSEAMPPHERKVLAVLKADESTQIDDIVERLEGVMSSSEIFAALFDLELAGKIRQMPGKNFVKTF